VELWLRAITNATPNATGSLNIVLRATVNDPLNGDITMVDFPRSFPFPLSAGAATFSSRVGPPCLPSCANLEVVRIEVLDQNRNLFARPGVWLLP